MEKKIYSKPILETEEFESQEYCHGTCVRVKASHLRYVDFNNDGSFDPATEDLNVIGGKYDFNDLILLDNSAEDGTYEAQATDPTVTGFNSTTTVRRWKNIGGQDYFGLELDPSATMCQHS